LHFTAIYMFYLLPLTRCHAVLHMQASKCKCRQAGIGRTDMMRDSGEVSCSTIHCVRIHHTQASDDIVQGTVDGTPASIWKPRFILIITDEAAHLLVFGSVGFMSSMSTSSYEGSAARHDSCSILPPECGGVVYCSSSSSKPQSVSGPGCALEFGVG
jgi:hypothetical protein